MSTIIIQHDDCRRHDPGPHHPESPTRINSVLDGLKEVAGLEYLPAPRCTPEQASRVHPLTHQEWLSAMEPEEGRTPLNEMDTLMNAGSMDANLRGSGGVCFAIEQVHAGKAANAFCAMRPPGHHSGTDFAMGFCLYNHIAIGARHAQSLEGIERVAIIDFDVHHGNGTQQIFEDDPSVMFVSSHQMPLYPGSGYMDETGCGNVLNLPLDPGAGSSEFRRAWSHIGLPAIHGFQPDFVLVSAGFDAHERDPLGAIEAQDADFEWVTREILELAKDSAAGRVVSTLEGGYDLQALSTAPRAHVEALLKGI